MEIANLEINILYFMCDPRSGPAQGGPVDARDIFDEFSDIPESTIESVIDSMAGDGLIAVDRARSRLSITSNGINRLQSSLACRIHRFDRCRCSAT